MKIKLSYSILSMVERGYIDDAISVWQGRDLPATPQMELGKKWHKVWEQETNKTGCLPKEFGGQKLEEFKTEYKLRRDFKLGDHEITLSGVVDLWEPGKNWATDYKTGKSGAGSFLSSFQHPLYSLLLPIDVFFYRAFNPYTKDVSVSWVHITDQERERGREYIQTWATEFINNLEYTGVI